MIQNMFVIVVLLILSCLGNVEHSGQRNYQNN